MMINEVVILKKSIPVVKGKTYIVDIKSLGHSCEGVGRFEDFTVFIPGALVGEQVEARITEVKKSYAKGSIVKILRKSPDRQKPICEIYEKCGGCQLQHLGYEAQLKMKHQQVVDAIERIGKQRNVEIYPTIGAENPWNYRNKMQFPIGLQKKQVVIGCFAQNSHDIVDTKNCRIQEEANNLIANAMREIVQKLSIHVYDEKTQKGTLRHVIGRVAKDGIMVVLVTATKVLPHAQEIVEHLKTHVPNLVSVMQNFNPKATNMIMGDLTKHLWGQKTILANLEDLTFHISARSFFQVNTTQAAVLYNKAVEYAGLTGKETVIDAYCGTGTITLFLAKKAKRVIGIEIVEPAIRDARKNAQDNKVSNAEFIVGDATTIMPRLYQEGMRPDVIVVDPPRVGCTPRVLQSFAAMKPKRIVYVSCYPASLARDLEILGSLGYKTIKVQPVDMFPQTSHVESVALIERK